MSFSLDSILPSLSSLGVLAYWLIGLASAIEAWFVTGLILPGSLVVDAGGILVQRGVLDFWDLIWFVAAGSVIGTEAGYWTGRLARARLTGRWAVESWSAYSRAEAMFRKRGGLALVLGRFAGPAAGLVPLVAALAGMDRRRFLIWSVLGSIPYALAHVGLGFLLGGVLAQMGPALTRAALIGGAIVLVLALTIWLVWRLVRLAPRILPVISAIGSTLAALPAVQRLRANHPSVAAFLAARFDRAAFTGLPLSALMVILVYIFTVWLDSVFEFLRSDPILQVDERLTELIHAFWTPGLLRFAAHVTALGDPRVVTALCLAALIWLAGRARFDLALGLILAVLGEAISVNLLKLLFHRPRPELAWFAESSNSFPSGHAAISIAFWGMLFFAFWRTGRLSAVFAALLGAIVALAIGASRLYLIEHFLTDVVNGWLVGAMWLVTAITLAEWLRVRHGSWKLHLSGRLRTLGGLAILALVFVGGWTTARYDKALAIPPAPEGVLHLASAEALFTDHGLPRETESLLGNPLEPINLLIAAPDAAALTGAMVKAGWTPARLASPAALTDALWALVANRPDPTAPVTPYFWDGQPNSMAFERPADAGGPMLRHHVRFWESGAVLPDGTRLFVGAASFDNGLDRTLLHHIAPDLDAERDQLAQDLTGSGVASSDGMMVVAGPARGKSVAGDPWFTDGNAALLTVKAAGVLTNP